MGVHMARNLLKNNLKLVVFDVNANAYQPFKSYGDQVLIGSSPADVAAQCDKILTMLPNGSDVKNVYSQKLGILE